jgi:hypothetical protein
MSLMSHCVDSQISSQFSLPISSVNIPYRLADRRALTRESLQIHSQ